MDVVRELIHNEAENVLNNSACIFSTPVKVVEDLGDELYVIETIATQSKYTVHNYSGSPVEIGENVLLYFKGSVISNKSAYIGASLNKPSTMTYIDSINSLESLSLTAKKISSFYFLVTASTTISLIFNVNIQSLNSGTATFTIIVDDNEYDYKPITNINEGYTHCAFSIPIPFEDVGVHKIEIKATGIGDITQVKAYMFGMNIVKNDWIITSDADYTYMTDMIDSNGKRSLRYISDYERIKTPTTLDGSPFLSIGYETFMTKNVTAVQIQAPVTTIE